jgi:hypothetical protein
VQLSRSAVLPWPDELLLSFCSHVNQIDTNIIAYQRTCKVTNLAWQTKHFIYSIRHNDKVIYFCVIKSRYNFISTPCSIIPSSQRSHVMTLNITFVKTVASYYDPYRQETLLIRLERPKHHCGLMQAALPWRPLHIGLHITLTHEIHDAIRRIMHASSYRGKNVKSYEDLRTGHPYHGAGRRLNGASRRLYRRQAPLLYANSMIVTQKV